MTVSRMLVCYYYYWATLLTDELNKENSVSLSCVCVDCAQLVHIYNLYMNVCICIWSISKYRSINMIMPIISPPLYVLHRRWFFVFPQGGTCEYELQWTEASWYSISLALGVHQCFMRKRWKRWNKHNNITSFSKLPTSDVALGQTDISFGLQCDSHSIYVAITCYQHYLGS